MVLNKVYHRFSKYLSNASWIIFEKILTMGITLLVTVFLARYLGPERYGVLAYAISLVAILAIPGHAGLSGLVIRELVKYPDAKEEIMGTSFMLKGLGYLTGFFLLIMYAYLIEGQQGQAFWVLLVLATMVLFQAFDVIDFLYQSRLEAKYTAISRSVAIVLSASAKIGLIFLGSGLIYIALAHALQALMSALCLVLFYCFKSRERISNWKVSFIRARELLSQGWLVFLGTIFAVIYLKVDQVMLMWLKGDEEVGIYAVAATLSEAWYFFPAAIVASVFPKLIQLKKTNPLTYKKRLQQLFDLLFILAICVAVLVTFFSEILIEQVFGASYIESANILTVHIWAAVFIFMRTVFSKWILIENVLVFSLITQGMGAVTNIILNLVLIPEYGGLGAAYATILSYAAASYVALLFSAKTRPVFWMMTFAMLSPFRYVMFKSYINNR
ncbi:hypothetical protein MNBD_GAMMA11-272 [hydrothermal vent metagenome]|uniref:Uncharacterized protein n=1 Tax=hydrothermal vent metagenome TaxID=652676 RepID=A0A3B0Y7I7_9ZZZZ